MCFNGLWLRGADDYFMPKFATLVGFCILSCPAFEWRMLLFATLLARWESLLTIFSLVVEFISCSATGARLVWMFLIVSP